MASDADAKLREQSPAYGTHRDAGRGLPGGGAFEDVARVVPVVFQQSREIGVSRTHACHSALPRAFRLGPVARCVFGRGRRGIHDFLPVLPIAVPNQHRDGRSDCLAGTDAREQLDGVLLDLHPSAAPIALLPARELLVDVAREQPQAGGNALENRNEGLSVGFAGGRESKHSVGMVR